MRAEVCIYGEPQGKGEFSQRQEITLGGSVKTSPMEKLTEEELRSLARLDGEQDDEELVPVCRPGALSSSS